MNTRKLLPFLMLFLILLGASACQSMQPTPVPTLPPVRFPTNPPVRRTPVVTPTPVASPTPAEPSPTPVEPAVKAAQDYFAALQNGDSEGAAALFSSFSLMVDQVTRGDAARALNQQIAAGTKWSDLEILETKPFDPRTTLVHVTYKTTQKGQDEGVTPGALPTATAKPADPTATAESEADAIPSGAEETAVPSLTVDEWWALRQESGQWRVNRGNLIDFETLEVQQQTTAGLTIKPRQLTRYTDRVRLTLLVQNQTNDPIFLGQQNEILAAFTFGDKTVEAAPTRLLFDRLRSYPDTVIDVPGLYEQYPDGIIIRKWKNVQEKPWFTFSFN